MKKTFVAVLLLAFSIAVFPVHADNPHGAVTVASVSIIGQSTSQPAQVIWTPEIDGLYEIKPYLDVRSTCTSGLGGTPTVSWTDKNGANQFSIEFQLPHSPFEVYAVAGTPISLTVNLNNPFNCTYDLILNVVKE